MKQEQSAGVITYAANSAHKRVYLVLEHQDSHWDLPKGKIEAGETLQETALRELREEAGISATLVAGFEQTIHYIFSDKEGGLVTKTATFFLGQASASTVTLSHEHADFKWLCIEEAVKLVTYENARQLLELADQFLERLEKKVN